MSSTVVVVFTNGEEQITGGVTLQSIEMANHIGYKPTWVWLSTVDVKPCEINHNILTRKLQKIKKHINNYLNRYIQHYS